MILGIYARASVHPFCFFFITINGHKNTISEIPLEGSMDFPGLVHIIVSYTTIKMQPTFFFFFYKRLFDFFIYIDIKDRKKK